MYLDSVRAFGSGTLTGSGARHIDPNRSGRCKRRLGVTDAGHGTSYDHAEWADPTLVCISVPARHPKSVGVNGALKVYGLVASAVMNLLSAPYPGDCADAKHAGQPRFGGLLALDLKTDHMLWTREDSPSLDSLAITPDEKNRTCPVARIAAARSGSCWTPRAATS